MKLRKRRLVEEAPVFPPSFESPSCGTLGGRVVGGLDFSQEPETGLCLDGMAEGVSGTSSGLPADGGLSRSAKDSEFPGPGHGPPTWTRAVPAGSRGGRLGENCGATEQASAMRAAFHLRPTWFLACFHFWCFVCLFNKPLF